MCGADRLGNEGVAKVADTDANVAANSVPRNIDFFMIDSLFDCLYFNYDGLL
jgi:hypothetical protein